jgi:hypothetical protein
VVFAGEVAFGRGGGEVEQRRLALVLRVYRVPSSLIIGCCDLSTACRKVRGTPVGMTEVRGFT